jgi:hypothetical protein
MLGERFLDVLVAANVIRRGERVRRVVIDAQIGEAVVIHVERFGDTRILDVVQTLAGVEVTARDADQEGARE